MKKLFCIIFIGSGALLVFAVGTIGLGFGAIYLMGAIRVRVVVRELEN